MLQLVLIWLESGATTSRVISFHAMSDTVIVKQWVTVGNSVQ